MEENICFDYDIAIYVLKKLNFFRENCQSFPESFKNVEDWHSIIDEIIFAFHFVLWDIEPDSEEGKEFKKKYKASSKKYDALFYRYCEGIDLFSQYFRNLWL